MTGSSSVQSSWGLFGFDQASLQALERIWRDLLILAMRTDFLSLARKLRGEVNHYAIKISFWNSVSTLVELVFPADGDCSRRCICGHCRGWW